MRWGGTISKKMRSPAFPPRRASAFLRWILSAVVIIVLFYYFAPPSNRATTPTKYASPGSFPHQDLSKPPSPHVPGSDKAAEQPAKEELLVDKSGQQAQDPIVGDKAKGGDEKNKPTAPSDQGFPTSAHPIDRLVELADQQFSEILSQESHSLADAAAAYRKRRGRHPPPGFDQWYAFAAERKAVLVESFWDQIYHDLEPFWALSPRGIRKEALEYEMTINIRNGNASARSDWFWTQIWLDMIKTIEHLLPDMDIALNAMDEPRMVVPWEDVNGYMKKAAKTLGMLPAKDVLGEYQKLPDPSNDLDKSDLVSIKKWEGTKPYWRVARRGCAPDSPARKAEVMTNFDHAPVLTPALGEPHMYRGFVSNYTMSTEVCHQPDIQGLNGIFIEPLTVSATKVLFPMFGGSKLAVNNEILLPAPMYWNEEERFTAGGEHGVDWPQKKDGVVWRGVATGGKNRETNWRAFQRHRFVSMNNGTKISRAEQRIEPPVNFALPGPTYRLSSQEITTAGSPTTKSNLGPWVDSWADVSFVDLMCANEDHEAGQCNYTSNHFEVTQGVKLAEQFNWKYLPDIDGNSFSGRYLGFLRSTSLPVKATVWREWHDSRLIAWKHFVPMDNRYGDWYGIMEYFLGYFSGRKDGFERPAHDKVAEKIASDGKDWAERVLRKEDMQIYVLRLLLEYARISDERREKMGWVGDLMSDVSSGQNLS